MSHLRAWGHKTRHRTGGRGSKKVEQRKGPAEVARSNAPLSLEAYRKMLQRAIAEMVMMDKKEDKTRDSKGTTGDLSR